MRNYTAIQWFTVGWQKCHSKIRCNELQRRVFQFSTVAEKYSNLRTGSNTHRTPALDQPLFLHVGRPRLQSFVSRAPMAPQVPVSDHRDDLLCAVRALTAFLLADNRVHDTALVVVDQLCDRAAAALRVLRIACQEWVLLCWCCVMCLSMSGNASPSSVVLSFHPKSACHCNTNTNLKMVDLAFSWLLCFSSTIKSTSILRQLDRGELIRASVCNW